MSGGRGKMRAGLSILVSLAALVVTGSVDSAPAACERGKEAGALVEEAQDLLAERTDETVEKALEKARKAAGLCPDLKEAWLLQASCWWEAGEALPKESKDQKRKRIEYFEKGEAAADRALALDPDDADALYSKTVNMASAADMKGWASSLWMFPTLLENMQKIDEIDPHYGYGSTDRFWGEVMTRVPLWLAARFGYDLEEDVIKPLEEELKLEPRYLGNYTYLARLLWKTGDEKNRDRALSLLKTAIESDPEALPEYRGDNRRQQEIARRMWKEYTGGEFPAR
jgi:tetratricopeptide (TPR) repeat protein